MELLQRLTSLLSQFSQAHDGWNISSEVPLVIQFDETDSLHPAVITLKANADDVLVFAHSTGNEAFQKVASDWLSTFDDQPREQTEGLFTKAITPNGFIVSCSVNEGQYDSFEQQLEKIMEHLVTELTGLIQTSYKQVQRGSIEEQASAEQEQAPAQQQVPPTEPMASASPMSVIQSYLDKEELNYDHNKERQYFRFGMRMEHYRDQDDSPSLQIVMRYSDPSLIRVETPMMYKFDLEHMPYEVIASVIVWYQFTYKFLSMTVDPSDGECKVSIDIPVMDGVIHPSQIDRIFKFVIQFSEDAHRFCEDKSKQEYRPKHKALFHLLVNASADEVKVAVDRNFDEHKKDVAAHQFMNELEGELKELSDEQRAQMHEEMKRALSRVKGQTDGDSQEPRGC